MREDFDIDFNALSVDEQADFLVNEADLDLVARQAASIGEFLALWVHCDAEKFIGRCVAAPTAKGKTSKKAPVPAASKAEKKKADAMKAKKKPAASNEEGGRAEQEGGRQGRHNAQINALGIDDRLAATAIASRLFGQNPVPFPQKRSADARRRLADRMNERDFAIGWRMLRR